MRDALTPTRVLLLAVIFIIIVYSAVLQLASMGYLPTKGDYKTAKELGKDVTESKVCVSRNPQSQLSGWEGCKAVCSKDVCNCGVPTNPSTPTLNIPPAPMASLVPESSTAGVCQIPHLNLEKFGDKEVTGPRKTPIPPGKRYVNGEHPLYFVMVIVYSAFSALL
jgi:hypothetical protein